MEKAEGRVVHKPVLLKEVLEFLEVKSNENFIDCTAGEGGHTIAILKNNEPNGKVLGIERDEEIYKETKSKTANFQSLKRLVLVNDSYINLKKIVEKENFHLINGILLDLGMSSWQLEKSKRGFSFLKDELLDMRYDLSKSLTAEKIINECPESKIEEILKDYGEEKFSKKISREIVKEREFKKISTTFQLVEIIKRSVPKSYLKGRIHYATKTFQALRIAVNDELNNLKKVLPDIVSVLDRDGRAAIISFHSLEDRIVKNFLREKEKRREIKILTKKPIIAKKEELILNPRARSAKLRALIKIHPG